MRPQNRRRSRTSSSTAVPNVFELVHQRETARRRVESLASAPYTTERERLLTTKARAALWKQIGELNQVLRPFDAAEGEEDIPF